MKKLEELSIFFFFNLLTLFLLIFNHVSFAGDIMPEFTGFYTNSYLDKNEYFKTFKLEDFLNESTCFLNEYIDKSKDYHLKIKNGMDNLIQYAKSIDPKSIFNGNPQYYSKCIFKKMEKGSPWFLPFG